MPLTHISVRRLAAFVPIALLAGCATSAVIVGQTHPAISPSQVRVYLHAPKKYQEVALLESSSKASFAITDQSKMDVVMTRLKEEAAKLGANGILLQAAGTQYAGSVSTGTATTSGNNAYGLGTSVGIFHKAGSGIAIFVEEE